MRKLIATVFNYSLNGLLADEGTEDYQFCMDLPADRRRREGAMGRTQGDCPPRTGCVG